MNATSKDIEKIIKAIGDLNFKLYLVGGSTRDLILNPLNNIKDIDISTDAPIDVCVDIVRKIGLHYSDQAINMGCISFQIQDINYTITQFRKEIYGNNRYPKIYYTNSIEVDSDRRDLTFNAIYYNYLTCNLIDTQNGIEDLMNGHIRSILDPYAKIKEDPIRIIRALRYCGLFKNYSISEPLASAILSNISSIKSLSLNKIKKEIAKGMQLKFKDNFITELRRYNISY